MFGCTNVTRYRGCTRTFRFGTEVASATFEAGWRLGHFLRDRFLTPITLAWRSLRFVILCLAMAGCVQFPIDSGNKAASSGKSSGPQESSKAKSRSPVADTAQDTTPRGPGADKSVLAAHVARGKKLRDAGDYSGAAKAFEHAAIAGDAWAQVTLGDFYLSGKGVEQSYPKALGWYIKAVKLGNAQAQHMLGVLYNNGWGVKRDSNLAMSWFEQSAQQGWAQGQYQLGLLLLNGQADPSRISEGLHWIRKAAEQGHAEAGFVLGSHIEQGKGTLPSIHDAMHWYREAAERGHAPAQFALAEIYQQGRPQVPRNQSEALKWFVRAAESGFADAQNSLAVLYAEGRGVSVDREIAVHWYTRAADQGHVVAQSNLATMHRYGMGTPINLVEAFKWYSLAAANGEAKHAGVQRAAVLAREKIAAKMDPAQRAEGKRRVLLWLETRQVKGMVPSSSEVIEPGKSSKSGASGYTTTK